MEDSFAYIIKFHQSAAEGKIHRSTFGIPVCCVEWNCTYEYEEKIYVPWFSIEEDYTGASMTIYYPKEAIVGESILIPCVDDWNGTTECETWIHGKKGLCKDTLWRNLFNFMCLVEDSCNPSPDEEE